MGNANGICDGIFERANFGHKLNTGVTTSISKWLLSIVNLCLCSVLWLVLQLTIPTTVINLVSGWYLPLPSEGVVGKRVPEDPKKVYWGNE